MDIGMEIKFLFLDGDIYVPKILGGGVITPQDFRGWWLPPGFYGGPTRNPNNLPPYLSLWQLVSFKPELGTWNKLE